MAKALALLSGGLDSTLAIRIILDQGIEVEAVNFFTPFCRCNSNSACGSRAKQVADRFGIKVQIFPVAEEYLAILNKPRYGYGKNLNPCIDCRILMHRKAKEYMQQSGAGFIITGEVLGQRPMSQHRAALNIIERDSGLKGLVLRPLSAKLFTPTIAEEKGWVDRERLLAISGRSRRPQMALAQERQIGDYPCPAGGCLLTDPGFSRRLKDLLAYGKLNLNQVELLKVGRHFRLSAQGKAVVGRDKGENERLTVLAQKGDLYFRPIAEKGPTAIARGEFSPQELADICAIVSRYCDSNGNGQAQVKPGSSRAVKIAYNLYPQGTASIILAAAIEEERLQRLRI